MKKILFYGGSFDPPHRIHRAMLDAAVQLVQPDLALVVPTGNASSYKNRDLTPAKHRLAMCELAFADVPQVQISSIEAQSSQPHYTIETLDALEQGMAGQTVQWFLLLGADQFAAITNWRRWQELLAKVTVVLADRAAAVPGAHSGGAKWMQNRHNSALCNVLHLPLTPNALSSTAVRLAFAKKNQNQSAQRLLDQALEPRVLRYIANHSLYL